MMPSQSRQDDELSPQECLYRADLSFQLSFCSRIGFFTLLRAVLPPHFSGSWPSRRSRSMYVTKYE